MYVLKIKFIFRNEAFPVFHYQQFKKKKKSTATNCFVIFVTPHPSWGYLHFFFSEGKYQAHSGSNCMLKPECWTDYVSSIYSIGDRRISDGLMALCKPWVREPPQYLSLSFQQHPYLPHGQFCKPFCFYNELIMPARDSNYFTVFNIYSQWSKDATTVFLRSETSTASFLVKDIHHLRDSSRSHKSLNTLGFSAAGSTAEKTALTTTLQNSPQFKSPLQFWFWPNAGL